MKYVDYGWDLSKDGIVFDTELNIAALGWHEGDYVVVKHIDGKNVLVIVDPLIKFLKDGEDV